MQEPRGRDGVVGVRLAALEREQQLEIGGRDGGQIASGDQEPSLDVALDRLTVEQAGSDQAGQCLADPEGVRRRGGGGEAAGAAERVAAARRARGGWRRGGRRQDSEAVVAVTSS